MRAILEKSKIFMVFILLLSCAEDDIVENKPGQNPQQLVNVQFGEDLTIVENEGQKEIIIFFDKVAPNDGELEIKVIADNSERFNLEPMAIESNMVIPVNLNDAQASLKITPVDNSIFEENQLITLELINVSEGFKIGTKKSLQLTLTDDDERVSPPPVILVGFASQSSQIVENNELGGSMLVRIGQPLETEVNVTVKVMSNAFELPFTSSPEVIDNLIQVTIEAGQTEAVIEIHPVNDQFVKQHYEYTFQIINSDGGTSIGDNDTFTLTVLDDELQNLPKSYEIVGGGWKARNAYIYDLFGRVQYVKWENETPFLRGGTYTYTYSYNNLVQHVNYEGGHEVYFLQEGGRIVKSEEYRHNIKVAYTLYDYDDQGNIAGRAEYTMRDVGHFELSAVYVYLYFLDGNLYKELYYTPIQGSDDFQLISTKAWEGYTNQKNMFPYEIIPGIAAQKHLPTRYTVDDRLFYYFSYELDEHGFVKRRTVSGSASEATTYEYY